jgi:hypothetical protein
MQLQQLQNYPYGPARPTPGRRGQNKMGRRKHDTSRYGVTLGRSRGFQIAGGFGAVFVVVILMLAMHGLTG